MGIREYDFENSVQHTNNRTVTKIENCDDYNECLKFIFGMFCLLLLIFVIGLIVTLIIVYG
jgi:hypothetical protein